jgi:hypothetical protein
MQINYYINNILVNRPLNFAELGIELNFDKDNSNRAVSINEFEFGLGDQIDGQDAVRLINEHLDSGDIFVGLPFRIELEHNNSIQDLYNGYLDGSTALFDCDKVIIQSKEVKGIDWINDVFDSKSFAYIFEKEELFTKDDEVNVPYVLSSLPNGQEAFLTLLSAFFIIKAIRDEIQALKDYLAELALPNADPTSNVEQAVKIISRLAYIALLIIALIELIRQMFDLLIQPIKYHSCMSYLKLARIGAESFGYIFKSSILESEPFIRDYHLPQKYSQTTQKKTASLLGLGFVNTAYGNESSTIKNTGYFDGTVGDLFRLLKTKYNAKLIINGDELRLERRDYNTSAANYILPPVDQTSFSLNEDELKSNYIVSFLRDGNDKNTVQNYEGNITQVITTTNSTDNKELILIKGLEEKRIATSRGFRKREFTTPELIAKALFQQVDAVAGSIKGTVDSITNAAKKIGVNITNPIKYTPLTDSIDDRKNMLLLENDWVDVPKSIILDVRSNSRQTDVSEDNDTYNNSLYLYNNFHFIESFIPSNEKPNANQYKIYEVENIPFCIDDYNLVKTSNFMKDDSGSSGEIISCSWNPETELANITYKINELYARSLEETKITPDGK